MNTPASHKAIGLTTAAQGPQDHPSVTTSHAPLSMWRHFDAAVFRQRSARHLRRWGAPYLLMAVSLLWFDTHYAIGLNASESLPRQVFLIERGERPGRGDYVAFRWEGGAHYPAGTTFIKVIAGVPGDTVTQMDGGYFVNCFPVGHAKSVSRQGTALTPGPTGILPEGRYYVRAPHPDSLDSRYALTGWVGEPQILGRAHALF
jgi:conjugal transfer pilin signal peptidase TrbI